MAVVAGGLVLRVVWGRRGLLGVVLGVGRQGGVGGHGWGRGSSRVVGGGARVVQLLRVVQLAVVVVARVGRWGLRHGLLGLHLVVGRVEHGHGAHILGPVHQSVHRLSVGHLRPLGVVGGGPELREAGQPRSSRARTVGHIGQVWGHVHVGGELWHHHGLTWVGRHAGHPHTGHPLLSHAHHRPRRRVVVTLGRVGLLLLLGLVEVGGVEPGHLQVLLEVLIILRLQEQVLTLERSW